MPKRLVLSDFDLTITKGHTFQNRGLTPADNTKAGVGTFLKHDNDTVSAIVSYHDDPNYIIGYVEHVYGLDKGSIKSINQSKGEHHVVTAYRVPGQEAPFIVCTLRNENNSFNAHVEAVKPTGKNIQIRAVMAALKEHGLALFQRIDFYDDDKNNTDKAFNIALPEVVQIHRVQAGGDKHHVIQTTQSKSSVQAAPAHLALMVVNDALKEKKVGIVMETRPGSVIVSRQLYSQADALAQCEALNKQPNAQFYAAKSQTGQFRVCSTVENAIAYANSVRPVVTTRNEATEVVQPVRSKPAVSSGSDSKESQHVKIPSMAEMDAFRRAKSSLEEIKKLDMENDGKLRKSGPISGA